MLNVLKTRIFQKYRTSKYPLELPEMPKLYKGMPKINGSDCLNGCRDCLNVCPVDAITKTADNGPTIDLGKCIFCGECEYICRQEAITFSSEHRMTTDKRSELIINSDSEFKHAVAVKHELLRIFKRSFRLRQVSAGGCNACEADTNVLTTVGFDLSRFGISFVASPRHADGLLVTGPVTKNMEVALRKTYEAIPAPKIVIAVGACAVSGGLFEHHAETYKGVADIIPVDFYVPGCPPHPLTILDGLLTVIKRNAT